MQSDFCLFIPDASVAIVGMSCDSSVIIVTRLQAGQSGFWIPAGAGDLSLFLKVRRPAVGHLQPLIQWVPRDCLSRG